MRLPHLHFPSAYKNNLLNLALMGGGGVPNSDHALASGAILIFDTSDNMWLKASLQEHLEACHVELWDGPRSI
jgi:hypothetical protein